MDILESMFDIKNEELIVWNNEVVMSSTERDYFEKLFSFLKKYSFDNILEIGYGLGISAGLIQKLLKPNRHDIVEINDEIYKDLLGFSKSHSNIKPLHDDWNNLSKNQFYDFIFSDPYDYTMDYSDLDAFTLRKNRFLALSQLIKNGGILCIPHFGDGYPQKDLYGYFTLVDNILLDVEPILMDDHTECDKCRILTYEKLSIK